MSTGRVLVAGSANLDFVVRAAHIPAPGETVLGREFQTFPGGKGANQAVAAARAGGAVTQMLLALGNDAHAVPVEASLRDAGVALDLRRQTAHATGVAFICLSDGAENAITVAPGANAALVAGDLPDLAGVDTLLLQLETPIEAVTAWATRAREAGVRVVLNAAPARALPASLLRQVDVLIVNEGELAMLAGDARDLITALKGVEVPVVVVTLGAAGCIARENTRLHLQPAFPVDAVDTTAAGDTFCGVFVAALARGETLQAGLRAAAAGSALACTALGAQSSVPVRSDVDALLRGDADAAGLDALAARCALSTV
jgi:ribokinase